MMLFFLIGFFIEAQYYFFIDDTLLNSINEKADTNQVGFDLGSYEDLYSKISYTKNLFSDYYSSASYKKNLEMDAYSLNLSFMKGFNKNNLRGLFLVDYSYLYFYEKNSFLLLSMQTGKSWDTMGFNFVISYFNSMKGSLKDRLFFSIAPFYLLKKSKIGSELSYYIVTKQDYFEKTKLLLKVYYSFFLGSCCFDVYIGNTFDKYYENESKLKNNTLLFGLKSTYDI